MLRVCSRQPCGTCQVHCMIMLQVGSPGLLVFLSGSFKLAHASWRVCMSGTLRCHQQCAQYAVTNTVKSLKIIESLDVPFYG